MKSRYEKRTGARRKAALCVSICMLFILCCTGCGKAKETKAGYLKAKDSVVAVYEYVLVGGQLAYTSDGQPLSFSGSGFFVGKEGEDPQYLITNHHVVKEYLDYGAGDVKYYTEQGDSIKSYLRVYFDSKDYVEAYVVGFDEAADVAVLRIESPTDKRTALKLCSPTEDMVGSTIYAIGYPGIADNGAVDSISQWGPNDLTVTSGVISRLLTTSGTGVRNIQVDVSIKHGNSGGPVVNADGMAVGISTSGYTEITGGLEIEDVKYARNIDEAITLLDQYNVPYTKDTGKGISVKVIIIVAVAGVAVVLAAVILIVLLSKKKKKGASATEAGAAQAPAAPSISETRAAQTPPAEKRAKASGDDSGYRLQGVAGALEGRRFMIRKNAPLTIGRNADSCNVVFPASTAGVSGKHCQVWFDSGCIWVKDLGSSHGTFLSAGTRLTGGQAVQIKPGEQISLGSSSEMLVVAQKGGN